ncbi:MAG: hypothetical protein ACMXYF_04085 [Candidatus Woesearchaeota archaeon]
MYRIKLVLTCMLFASLLPISFGIFAPEVVQIRFSITQDDVVEIESVQRIFANPSRPGAGEYYVELVESGTRHYFSPDFQFDVQYDITQSPPPDDFEFSLHSLFLPYSQESQAAIYNDGVLLKEIDFSDYFDLPEPSQEPDSDAQHDEPREMVNDSVSQKSPGETLSRELLRITNNFLVIIIICIGLVLFGFLYIRARHPPKIEQDSQSDQQVKEILTQAGWKEEDIRK